MRELEKIQGFFNAIIYRNSDNNFVIGDFSTEEESFIVKGHMDDGTLSEGLRLCLTGDFVNHSKYGRQFQFVDYEFVLPKSGEEVYDFLVFGEIYGVGEERARLIFEAFGDESLEVIENTPERLTKIRGIGDATAEKIHQSFMEKIGFSIVASRLKKIGISTKLALKLYKEYGSECASFIEANPYILASGEGGLTFSKVDKIAINMGIAKGDVNRIKAGLLVLIKREVSTGSTYIKKNQLLEEARELLDVSSEEIEDVILDCCYDLTFKVEEAENEERVFLHNLYSQEVAIPRALAELENTSGRLLKYDGDDLIDWCCSHMDIVLSDGQRQAVKNGITSKISIITGGPGTGKTTILTCIAQALIESEFKVAICAPTGRAAKRIEEATGFEAKTIHRLLEFTYSEIEDTMRFGKNREEPLDADAVIVDEASMIDMQIMKALLEALKPETRLVLVGDRDQLPPVGAGQVLTDLMASERIPVTVLRDIFRQGEGSDIILNAHLINRGELPILENQGDFFFMERSQKYAVKKTICELASHRLSGYYQLENPAGDIQILTPTRRGELGSRELNKVLQNTLNPADENKPEITFGDRIFRLGDKVMQIKNNYQMKWISKSTNAGGLGVFNGDIGYIVYVDNKFKEVGVVYEDDRVAKYEKEDLEQLEHAYAITVHKSQGSEFPIVIMPIGDLPPMLCNKNILYTGITRAKEIVVLVGSKFWLSKMVEGRIVSKRNTGLAGRITRLFDALSG